VQLLLQVPWLQWYTYAPCCCAVVPAKQLTVVGKVAAVGTCSFDAVRIICSTRCETGTHCVD
jgi:hypothetical protein